MFLIIIIVTTVNIINNDNFIIILTVNIINNDNYIIILTVVTIIIIKTIIFNYYYNKVIMIIIVVVIIISINIIFIINKIHVFFQGDGLCVIYVWTSLTLTNNYCFVLSG